MAASSAAAFAVYLGQEVTYVGHNGADRNLTVWAARVDGSLLCGGPVTEGFRPEAATWFHPARLQLPALAGGCAAGGPGRPEPGLPALGAGVVVAAARLPAAIVDEQRARTPSRSPRRGWKLRASNAPARTTEEVVREQWAQAGPFDAVGVLYKRDGDCSGMFFLRVPGAAAAERALAWRARQNYYSHVL